MGWATWSRATIAVILTVAATGVSPASAAGQARCRGVAATIVGTAGADRLVGTNASDVIAGLGGGDSILGLGGDDVLCGGPGSDVLDVGGGSNQAYGGAGSDTLKDPSKKEDINRFAGGAGQDLLTSSDPHDSCQYDCEPGTYMSGGPGVDGFRGTAAFVRGGAGDDRISLLEIFSGSINGGSGNDRIDGHDRDFWTLSMTFRGGAGNDVIIGTTFGWEDCYYDGFTNDCFEYRERLYGGGGDDRLDGARGLNSLFGGPGRDTCRRGKTTGCE